MTATFATPRIELIDCLIAADLEVDRLLGRLRGLARRLIGARRHLARPDARTTLGRAYLHRVEDEYGEALGELRAARRVAHALVRVS
jgi:hypothetical protein